MPTPYHCHECDSPTMNPRGICNSCMDDMWEPTTADEFNQAHKSSVPDKLSRTVYLTNISKYFNKKYLRMIKDMSDLDLYKLDNILNKRRQINDD